MGVVDPWRLEGYLRVGITGLAWQGIGWNPASNSEGGESFVVGEVQERRWPLFRDSRNDRRAEIVPQAFSIGSINESTNCFPSPPTERPSKTLRVLFNTSVFGSAPKANQVRCLQMLGILIGDPYSRRRPIRQPTSSGCTRVFTSGL